MPQTSKPLNNQRLFKWLSPDGDPVSKHIWALQVHRCNTGYCVDCIVLIISCVILKKNVLKYKKQ